MGTEIRIGTSPEEGGDSQWRADGIEWHVFDGVGGRLRTLLNFCSVTASVMNAGNCRGKDE